MSYRIVPEYRGEIGTAFLPIAGNALTDEVIGSIGSALSKNSGADIHKIGLSSVGGQKSLWIRDPATFTGYENDKPHFLMSRDSVLYGVGSPKDFFDKEILKEYMESRGVSIEEAPFLVIGGDCLITDRHAIVGWATSQVSGHAYKNLPSAKKAIKEVFGKLELDTIILDDISGLCEEKYHERRNAGFFHLDTVLGFVYDKGNVRGIVSEPVDVSPNDHGDSRRYTEYVCETLSKNGYDIERLPAIVSDEKLWSPVNILSSEKSRIVLLADSYDDYMNKSAADMYSEMGYRVETIGDETILSANKAGVRCACLAIKS